jgi:hypothetical protein
MTDGTPERRGPQLPDEHHLAGEEVPEPKLDVEVVVEPLLARKLDVASHRQRARISSAAMAASIRSPPSPVITAKPARPSSRPT